MQAVFRVDASDKIGGGHIMRCLSLAAGLTDAGWDCGFACNKQALSLAQGLRRHDNLIVPVADPSTAAMMEKWKKPWDIAVVDHYDLGEDFEKSLRKRARRILAIDDMNTRLHHCDILIDQTLDRTPEDYKGLVPRDSILLLGPSYALLRPEFAEARIGRTKRKTNSRLTKIVIGFGLSDPDNLSLLALEAIRETGLDLSVDVIVGTESPHMEALRACASNMKQTVNIYLDPVNIAEILSNADLAIGAAGVSAWERCCVGLPTLMGILVDNQHDIGVAIERRGAAKLLGYPQPFDRSHVANGIVELSVAPWKLDEMSKAALEICDGRGALRVMMAVLPPELTRFGRRVSLRFACTADTRRMFTWQCDEKTRQHSRNRTPPDLDDHREWVASALEDPSRFLTIILCDDKPAGVLRLDRIDRRDPDCLEISILVAPDLQSRGIATAALQFCHKIWPRNRVLAEVMPGNTASRALFKRAGYRAKSNDIYVREPLAMSIV